jgi:arylsulfatase B
MIRQITWNSGDRGISCDGRPFLTSLTGLVVLIACGMPGLPTCADEVGKQPNIILLIADDLGYADLAFLPFAAEDVRTPHLDRLAADGVYFPNAYVTSPICSASRAGIITGQYQQRWGNYSLGKGGYGLPGGEPTIPEMLKDLGYVCKKIGKNHFGGGDASPPWLHGFDEFLGFDGSTKDYVRLSNQDIDQMGRQNATTYTINAGPLTRNVRRRAVREKVSYENTYSTDVFAAEAVEFVRRDHYGKPFYLHVAFNAVHHPQYQVNPRYLEPWGLTQMMWTPDCSLTPSQWHETHGWLGQVDPDGRRRYLACLFAMDEAVGSILDALDEKDIADETLVVFLSDNGGSQNTYSCNGFLHGHKYTLAEGGIRVPLIMRWPGRMQTGQTIEAATISLDIAATCVEAAGGTPPQCLDGRSLLHLTERQSEDAVGEALFWDQGTKDRPDWAVRMGPWKLRQAPGTGSTRTYCGANDYGRTTIERNGLVFYDYPTPSGTLLYNLDEDPGEQRNLAVAMPGKVAELMERYTAWRSQMADPFNRRELLKQNKPLPPRLSN